MSDLLALSGLTPDRAGHLLDTARAIRRTGLPPTWAALLAGRTVAVVCLEPSTRTRVSFDLAATDLGAHVLHLDAAGSSATKGEGLPATLATLSAAGVDVVVVRTPGPLSAEDLAAADALAAPYRRAAVINAGDGAHEHPTQALGDAALLAEHLGGAATSSLDALAGSRLVIVGDLANSRVARSHAALAARTGARVLLVAPRQLAPDLADGTWPAGVHLTHDLDEALAYSPHAVLALRPQRERGTVLPAGYAERYLLTAERLAALPDTLVLHPGPAAPGLDLHPELLTDPRTRIAEQVSWGRTLRTVVLAAALD